MVSCEWVRNRLIWLMLCDSLNGAGKTEGEKNYSSYKSEKLLTKLADRVWQRLPVRQGKK